VAVEVTCVRAAHQSNWGSPQRMRILLLTTHFPPELTGNAPLLAELCDDLAARGHAVEVLAGPAEHNVTDLSARYRRLGICRERIGAVPVTRINGLPIRGAWPRRLMVLAWFPFAALWVGLAGTRCDIILCPSPPLWLGLTARLLGWARRIPYVYVVQDLWPDAPIRLGLVTNRAVVRILRAIEQVVYRGASRIITIMPAMTRRLSELGVPREKMEEIPNWVDVGFFATPAAPAEPSFRTRLGLEPDDVLVLYSGNMGRSHPLTLVVQAAARLRERENLKFALIGAGAGLAPAKAEAEAAHLSSIRFLPFQPRAALPDVLAGAGIAVVTQLSGMGAFSLPSRMYMFMAAGLPIIGSFDADSGAAELLASAQCGIQVNPNEPDWLAAAIARLADDLGLRRRLGEAGREYVLRCCDRRMAGTSYERVLLAAREREA